LANCVGLAFVFLSRSYGAGSSILGLTSVGIHKPLCPANVSNGRYTAKWMSVTAQKPACGD